MIKKISKFRYTIISVSVVVLLLIARYNATSICNTQESATEKPIEPSASIDTVAIRQTKIELLKVEMAQRHEGRLARENRFIQSKALFVTLLTVLLGFMYDKSTGKIKLSKHTVSLIVVLSFLFYWYDVYLVDQQERNSERNRKIIEHLELIPKLKAVDVDTIRVYSDLSEKNPCKKFVLLLLPKYEHIFFLFPIVLVLAVCSYRELCMFRKKDKKKKKNKEQRK